MKEPFIRIISVIIPAIIIFILIQINIPRPIAIFNCATCELNVYNDDERLTWVSIAYFNHKEKKKIGKRDIEMDKSSLDVCQLLNQNDHPIKFDSIIYFTINVNAKAPGRLLIGDELIGKDSLIEIYQMRS